MKPEEPPIKPLSPRMAIVAVVLVTAVLFAAVSGYPEAVIALPVIAVIVLLANRSHR